MRTSRMLVALATTAALGTVASTADARSSFFFSPTGNIGCQMVDKDARLRPSVFCQSASSRTSVTLSKNGALKVCRRSSRCIGDAPYGTGKLAYGKQRTLGRFRCVSRRDGVRCRIIATGRGFHIDRTSVKPLR